PPGLFEADRGAKSSISPFPRRSDGELRGGPVTARRQVRIPPTSMATGRSRERRTVGSVTFATDELSAAKQARVLRDIMTDPAAFDAWVLRHPRGLAAAFGFCGPPRRFFESVSQSIKKARQHRMTAERSKEEQMANRKTRKHFSGVDELRGNIPWQEFIVLIAEIKIARRKNEILLPLATHILDLQSVTARAHKSAGRPALKPNIDNAVKVARRALTDLAVHDIDTAQRRLRELESAIHDIQTSL